MNAPNRDRLASTARTDVPTDAGPDADVNLNAYITADPWSIIEEGFDPARVTSSESLFALGNGAMGQRANFEESYSGDTFQGSYIAGVYYPDKTRVGWWKNGYPEYFAKVLNAPNWIGIDVAVNGQPLDLATVASVDEFRRELNMREGWYRRTFTATMADGARVAVEVTRFLSLARDELGAIRYRLKPLDSAATVAFTPYLDAGIHNEDSNWDDQFWDVTNVASEPASSSPSADAGRAFIEASTMKTGFATCTFMAASVFIDAAPANAGLTVEVTDTKVAHTHTVEVEAGETATLIKFGGYTVDRHHPADQLVDAARRVLNKATGAGYHAGYTTLATAQAEAWDEIWSMADITIEGDVKAQQAIRFNIFQLNQTYLGTDSRLNIGPKGFTGEKYGGSTYWDTEAYCLPFYMATKGDEVARNLLQYRHNHLAKAIENAEKLGFGNGAALYPMVTMNGEECHNEWEITFEEIHRNSAIAYAIFNHARYTGDNSYVQSAGMEVLIGIARFWYQRANWSADRQAHVILGVTGPNEYENNVNNNFYTNYSARWCIRWTTEQLNWMTFEAPNDHAALMERTGLTTEEVAAWNAVADDLVLPFDRANSVYLQQDGFLDKVLAPAAELDPDERPINQHWSWDRILRSVYIKQADVLQGFYFFADDFSDEELARHFDFYEPFTVHESSLSPCVHAILAARLGRLDQAYAFYLRTSRLDLDDYNAEVHEGLHITSMAGTWMSIVEGFGGLRVIDDQLAFRPRIPAGWSSYSFRINFRDRVVKIVVEPKRAMLELAEGAKPLAVRVNDQTVELVEAAATEVMLT